MLFLSNKMIKKQWTTNGIFLWDVLEIIIVSTFPVARNSIKTRIGIIIVTMAT